jgi:LmbE family N-acetylglucosaminyl deacetylase
MSPDAPEVTTIHSLVGSLRPRRAMVLVAHPDDAEFMCGGTVALLARAGWEVVQLVATNGNKGTKDPRRTSQMLAAEREQEQREAARILGAHEPIFLGFGDGELESDDELRGLVVRELRRLRPTLVITWDGFRPGFNHRDHRRIGRATYDAIWPDSDDRLFYAEHLDEGLEPHRPHMMLLGGAGEPDVYVDVEPVLETKVEAVSAHVSQVGRSPAQLLRFWRQRAEAEARARGEDEAALPRYREAFRRVEWQRQARRRPPLRVRA